MKEEEGLYSKIKDLRVHFLENRLQKFDESSQKM
jgi:hypothetical protein